MGQLGEGKLNILGEFQIYLCLISMGREQEHLRHHQIQFLPRVYLSSHVFTDVSLKVTLKEEVSSDFVLYRSSRICGNSELIYRKLNI